MFRDRSEAGRQLAKKLGKYANRDDVIVLALPRGGVPVAFEVAQAISAPLDVFVVRKLGVPGQEELAMGAIASGGVRVLNPDVLNHLRVPAAIIDDVAERESKELNRRESAYRGGLPALSVAGKTTVLIDDGLATGSTMRAAIAALKERQKAETPAAIIVAVPVAPTCTNQDLMIDADEVIALLTPDRFYSVGRWYDDFRQTSDEEVRALLHRATANRISFHHLDSSPH
jgi:putative phosphoribosyl transferase